MLIWPAIWYSLRMETATANVMVNGDLIAFKGEIVRENKRVYVFNTRQIDTFDVLVSAADLNKAADAIAEAALSKSAFN